MLAPETPVMMPVQAPHLEPTIDKQPASIQAGINSILELIKEEREKAAQATRRELQGAYHAEKEQALAAIQQLEAEKFCQKAVCESLRAHIRKLESKVGLLETQAGAKIETLEARVEELVGNLVKADKGRQDVEVVYALKIETLEARVGELIGDLVKADKGHQDTEAVLALKEQALQQKTVEADEGSKTKADLTTRVAELQEELASSGEQRTDYATKLDDAERRIKNMEESSKADADKWKGERTTLQGQVACLSAKHAQTQQHATKMQHNVDRTLAQMRDGCERKVADAEKERTHLVLRIAELESDWMKASTRVRELEQALAHSQQQYENVVAAINDSGFIQVRETTISVRSELYNCVISLATHTSSTKEPQSLSSAPPTALCAALERCEIAVRQMREGALKLQKELRIKEGEAQRTLADASGTAGTKLVELRQELQRTQDELKSYKAAFAKLRQMGESGSGSSKETRTKASSTTAAAGSTSSNKPSSSVPAKRPPPSTSTAPPKKLQKLSESSVSANFKPAGGRTAQPAASGSQPPGHKSTAPSANPARQHDGPGLVPVGRKSSSSTSNTPSSSYGPVHPIKLERNPLPSSNPSPSSTASKPHAAASRTSDAASTSSAARISSASRPTSQLRHTTDPRLKQPTKRPMGPRPS
ncbi:hypothetical protein BD626DRAFT_498865 [Schizophyllum amplum]|uniref:Uncharacterized protein n=1 Tax=Schizophyllum amplum TaxID=97359 RepID=A0A550CBZ3_9AGAR|nr:hypothetical protein BD626DRAFT_498865 [Auriculariopsis ampla]